MNKSLMILACLIALGACSKKVVEPEVKFVPTANQMLDAMVRGHPKSKMVCIDEIRTRAFFINYGPEATDEKFRGWLFIEGVDFYQTSNNSVFISDMEIKRYVPVYPDVSNLKCKEQNG